LGTHDLFDFTLDAGSIFKKPLIESRSSHNIEV
jgi:hypothetical protein